MSKNTINVHEKSYDHEMNLLEIFNILWSKKLFIVAFTSSLTVISIFYAINKTPIYVVKRIFEIGIANEVLVDNVSRLVNEINIVENINVPSDVITRLSSIKLMGGTDNLIELKVESTSSMVFTPSASTFFIRKAKCIDTLESAAIV